MQQFRKLFEFVWKISIHMHSISSLSKSSLIFHFNHVEMYIAIPPPCPFSQFFVTKHVLTFVLSTNYCCQRKMKELCVFLLISMFLKISSKVSKFEIFPNKPLIFWCNIFIPCILATESNVVIVPGLAPISPHIRIRINMNDHLEVLTYEIFL